MTSLGLPLRLPKKVAQVAFLVWTPFDWVSLSGLVDVTQNWSTVDDNEYFAWVASPSVRLTLGF